MSFSPLPSGIKLSAPIDQRLVRQLFSLVGRVDESDFLCREISARMHERLALVRLVPQRVLDAGCGAGADFPILQDRFPDARILGLDAAPSRLHAARRHQYAALSSMNKLLKKWLPKKRGVSFGATTDLLCGDFAQLPLERGALDLVWSNLALHWHPQPDRVFAEWHRVLRTNGLLMFSCFGPDTFKEVRSAFTALDDAPHALPFVDMHDFGDMLVNAGFSTPVMDMETLTVTYGSAEKLLADVRAFGGNPLKTRRQALTGRAGWVRMLQALDGMRRSDGKIPLTFEVIYGHAFRPAPKSTSGGETIIRLDWPKKAG